jgi:hypothetical protein
MKMNIFHKNREISILTIKKKTARLTLPQEATERTKQGETIMKMNAYFVLHPPPAGHYCNQVNYWLAHSAV